MKLQQFGATAARPRQPNAMFGALLLAAVGLMLSGALGCASSAAVRRAERDGDLLVLDLAREFVARGAYDAAVPLLHRAASQHPESAEVHFLYGVVLRERGVYGHAESELRKSIELAPKRAAGYAALGILLDTVRRHREAGSYHQKAVELEPGNGRYWNNLGFSAMLAESNDEAITALERAVALEPSLTIAYNNLGFAHGRAKHYAAALRYFRTAGGDRAAKLNLALVYERNGDVERAAALREEVTE